MKKTYYCKVSGQPIPDERVAALRILEVPESNWTLKEYSNVSYKRGVYLGESGTSEMLIVKKVDNHTVRDILDQAGREDEVTERAISEELEDQDDNN